MKIIKYILFITYCLICSYNNSQQNNWLNKVVADNELHIGVIGIGNHPVLKSYNMYTKELPIVTLFMSTISNNDYSLPLCWDIDRYNKIVYLINSLVTIKHSDYIKYIDIQRVVFGFSDSSKYFINDTLVFSEFPKYHHNEQTITSLEQRNSFFEIYVNDKMLEPIHAYFKKYYEEQIAQEQMDYSRFSYKPPLKKPYQMTDITYDFCWLHDNIFTFYIRDDNQLTQWKYTYTEEKTVKPEDWQEQHTWSTQNVGSYTIQHENPYLPSGKKHIYNCIKDTSTNIMLTDTSFVLLRKVLPDSTLRKLLPIQGVPFTNDNDFNDTLFARIDTIQAFQFKKWIKQTGRNLFFKGFIEAIVQNGHTFIINRHYGGIYWLSKNGIYRIAQIDINNYPKKLLGKKLFIEDRDNEQLIFFAPVTKLNEQVPYPNIKIIQNKREFNRMFKNVPSN